ncbi:MAG: sodium-dependent bicarbonate transport family permease [Beijerinckiaceae bacterium]
MALADIAAQNLLSPMALFFALGFAAALARSDLAVPEAVAKLLSLYLLMSIGFKGGVEVAHHGLTRPLATTIGAGVLLSFALPFVAYALLRATTRVSPVDAASIAGHYGSISAVTFAAVTGVLTQLAIPYEGFFPAVAAAMETPAIFAALAIAGASGRKGAAPGMLREIALNGSIVMLLGSFVIGAISGGRGMTMLKPFIVDPYAGFLCLFLLDMGLVAGRGLAKGRRYITPALGVFAIAMPLVGACCAAALAWAIGLSAGGAAVLITLAASASYIAAPAAMRLALPEANPGIALTLSLALTFPFNLLVGIPLYIAAARHIAS